MRFCIEHVLTISSTYVAVVCEIKADRRIHSNVPTPTNWARSHRGSDERSQTHLLAPSSSARRPRPSPPFVRRAAGSLRAMHRPLRLRYSGQQIESNQIAGWQCDDRITGCDGGSRRSAVSDSISRSTRWRCTDLLIDIHRDCRLVPAHPRRSECTAHCNTPIHSLTNDARRRRSALSRCQSPLRDVIQSPFAEPRDR